MNLFKALFGTKEESLEEKKKNDEARKFDVLKYDGVRALKTHQAAYAVQCFNHALEMQDDMECHDYLSQALIMTGELAAAYEQLRIMAEAEPDNKRILMRMAEVSYMMENYGAMADACEKVLIIDNSDAQAYLYYGRACRAQGDDTNAVAMLTKAIALRDDLFEAYLLRGETLLSTGNVAEAEEDCALLRQKVEDNEDILLLAARIETAKGEHQRAIDIYNKVLDLDPFSIAALRERAAAKQATGDNDGAEADLKAADELEPKDQAQGQAGAQDIEQQVKQAYRNIDPVGLFNHD